MQDSEMASVTANQDLFESPPANRPSKLDFNCLAAKDEIMDQSSMGSPDKSYEEDEDTKKVKKYINACYINGLVRNHSEKSTIACSAPIAKTVPKFWQMIWENKVKLIVMLCPEYVDREEPMNYCLGQGDGKEEKVGHEYLVGPEGNKEFMKIKLLKRE
jgi:hypothetical protein